MAADTLRRSPCQTAVELCGGESRQGGAVLSTVSKVPGKQSSKRDSSKAHDVPMSTSLRRPKKRVGRPAKTAPSTTHSTAWLTRPVTAALTEESVLKLLPLQSKKETRWNWRSRGRACTARAEELAQARQSCAATDEAGCGSVDSSEQASCIPRDIEKKMGSETREPYTEAPKAYEEWLEGRKQRSTLVIRPPIQRHK